MYYFFFLRFEQGTMQVSVIFILALERFITGGSLHLLSNYTSRNKRCKSYIQYQA